MAANLTNQVREIAHVVRLPAQLVAAKGGLLTLFSLAQKTKSVARGNLSNSVTVDVQGEMLDLKVTGTSLQLAPVEPASSSLTLPIAVNEMVQQLTTLANEVTRVSLEVGTEGKLGGQVSCQLRLVSIFAASR